LFRALGLPVYPSRRLSYRLSGNSDLDPGEITEGKFDLDVVGHYARPDVFQLGVNEKSGFSWLPEAV
jgi:hypothetical protein